MIWREIVNDRVGGVPVTVTYCPLCNSSIVFDRRVGGKVLDSGTTGKLRNSDLVIYDRQTESWWQQFLGLAIIGEMTGKMLKMFPARPAHRQWPRYPFCPAGSYSKYCSFGSLIVIGRVMGARIIVIGNEKGGSGKSTAAMHLAVGLMRAGNGVCVIDLDIRQGTLSRFLENRRAFAERRVLALPIPKTANAENGDLADLIDGLKAETDVVLIDTPGNDTKPARAAHALADTLITPMNDSLIDLDVLARIDGATQSVLGPSHYAEMVWEQRKKRAALGGKPVDWIVMRNRLSNLDARNKRDIARLLADLSARIGFRVIAGFGERVVYRELFSHGLTMMDLDVSGLRRDGLTISEVAARQEVRSLIEAL